MFQRLFVALALVIGFAQAGCNEARGTLRDSGRLELVVNGESEQSTPFRVDGTFNIQDLQRGGLISVSSYEEPQLAALGRELRPGLYSVSFDPNVLRRELGAGALREAHVARPLNVTPVSNLPLVVNVVAGKTTQVRFHMANAETARLGTTGRANALQ